MISTKLLRMIHSPPDQAAASASNTSIDDDSSHGFVPTPLKQMLSEQESELSQMLSSIDALSSTPARIAQHCNDAIANEVDDDLGLADEAEEKKEVEIDCKENEKVCVVGKTLLKKEPGKVANLRLSRVSCLPKSHLGSSEASLSLRLRSIDVSSAIAKKERVLPSYMRQTESSLAKRVKKRPTAIAKRCDGRPLW